MKTIEPLRRPQRRQGGPGGEQRARDVEGEDLVEDGVEAVVGDVGQRRVEVEHADEGDGGVDAAPAIERRGRPARSLPAPVVASPVDGRRRRRRARRGRRTWRRPARARPRAHRPPRRRRPRLDRCPSRRRCTRRPCREQRRRQRKRARFCVRSTASSITMSRATSAPAARHRSQAVGALGRDEIGRRGRRLGCGTAGGAAGLDVVATVDGVTARW